jgi:hypothetical protein
MRLVLAALARTPSHHEPGGRTGPVTFEGSALDTQANPGFDPSANS